MLFVVVRVAAERALALLIPLALLLMGSRGWVGVVQIVLSSLHLGREDRRAVVPPHGLDTLHLGFFSRARGSSVVPCSTGRFDARGVVVASPHAADDGEEEEETDEHEDRGEVDEFEPAR